ncbi:MAG: hypothetical protein KDA42_09355 [Planctomycetales bacterium]|nr:hypothetical protein [Planctomycetales bacterium]
MPIAQLPMATRIPQAIPGGTSKLSNDHGAPSINGHTVQDNASGIGVVEGSLAGDVAVVMSPL